MGVWSCIPTPAGLTAPVARAGEVMLMRRPLAAARALGAGTGAVAARCGDTVVPQAQRDPKQRAMRDTLEQPAQ